MADPVRARPRRYVSWVAVAVTGWVLYRTRAGLALRAIGEDPAAADAAGLDVVRVRYAATLIGGMTAGIGWIAVALVILAGWWPGLVLVGAYAFGALPRPRVHAADRPGEGAVRFPVDNPVRRGVPRGGRRVGEPGQGPQGRRPGRPRPAVLTRGTLSGRRRTPPA